MHCRAVAGLAYGLAQVTISVHISDIASKRMREKIVGFAIILTAASTAICLAFDVHLKFIEITTTVIALIAIVFIPFLDKETPAFYLLHNKKDKSWRNFTKLNGKCKTNRRTMQKYNDLKVMINEDIRNGRNIFTGGNLRPLWLIFNSQLMSIVLNSMPFMVLLTSITSFTIGPLIDVVEFFPLLLVILFLRFFFSMTFPCLGLCVRMDRLVYVLGLIFAKIISSLFATSFMVGSLPTNATASIFYIILLIFIVFLSVAVDYNQFHQSIEAFSTTKKSWSLAFISAVENSIQIGFIFMHLWFARNMIGSRSRIEMIPITVIVAFTSIVLLIMTRNVRKLSVRETRQRYNRTFQEYSEKSSDELEILLSQSLKLGDRI